MVARRLSPTSLEASIHIETCDESRSKALYRALKVEAENPPDPERGEMRVEVRDDRVVVHIRARDYSSARALLNAVLTLTASLTDTLNLLDHRDTSRGDEESRLSDS